jgi:hypothetical protein
VPRVPHAVVGQEQQAVPPAHLMFLPSQSGHKPQAPPLQKYRVDLSFASNAVLPQKTGGLSGFPLQKGGGGGDTTAVATQLPPWHAPPLQAVPSGSFALHLPFLRFLQGGHGFFLATASSRDAAATRPSAPPRTVVSALRREPAVVRERVRVSKRESSMGECLCYSARVTGGSPVRTMSHGVPTPKIPYVVPLAAVEREGA